jgi:Methyltransferase domain
MSELEPLSCTAGEGDPARRDGWVRLIPGIIRLISSTRCGDPCTSFIQRRWARRYQKSCRSYIIPEIFSFAGVASVKRAEVAQYWEANAETWTRHARAGYDIYRDGLNTPAFLDMLPPVHGLSGLDIGCGEGSNTRELVRLGARMHAIDVAPTFTRYARDAERAEPLGIAYFVADATDLPFASGSFDFATAFMSMMDMPTMAPPCAKQHGSCDRAASFNSQYCTRASFRRIAAS